ncbi:hypothetical protein AOA12_16560 [Microbacterium sp. No. 7]|nr:hypothetical protein AOA12_16560 [Microbacterium sp. No. 7]
MTRIPSTGTMSVARRGLVAVVTTGSAIAAGAASAGIQQSLPPVGVLLLCLAGVLALVALSVADIRSHQIPDRLLLPLSGLMGGWLAAAVALGTPGAAAAVGDAVVAGAVLAAVYFVLGLMGAVGLGDVKLAGVLGLWVGGLGGFSWMLIPMLAVGISGTHQLARRVLRRPGAVAHGPALAVASVLCAAVALSG